MENKEDILQADKILFSIDLVDYIIVKTRPNFADRTINILERADRLRNLTYNRFNKTIRNALNIIDTNEDSSVYGDFEVIMDQDQVNKEAFIEYANCCRLRFLSDEFQAKSFLKYCDRVANMAGYFLSFGIDGILEAAVDLIIQAFPESIMYHANWNKLTKFAETLELLGNKYYRGESSESSSEMDDSISVETDDNTSDSVNMDVNVSSPEEMPQKNLDSASSILKKISENIMNTNGSSSKTAFDMLNAQSSNCASSILSPIESSSSNGILASSEKAVRPKNGS